MLSASNSRETKEITKRCVRLSDKLRKKQNECEELKVDLEIAKEDKRHIKKLLREKDEEYASAIDQHNDNYRNLYLDTDKRMNELIEEINKQKSLAAKYKLKYEKLKPKARKFDSLSARYKKTFGKKLYANKK